MASPRMASPPRQNAKLSTTRITPLIPAFPGSKKAPEFSASASRAAVNRRSRHRYGAHAKRSSPGEFVRRAYMQVLQAVGLLLVLVFVNRCMNLYGRCVQRLSTSPKVTVPGALPKSRIGASTSRRLAYFSTSLPTVIEVDEDDTSTNGSGESCESILRWHDDGVGGMFGRENGIVDEETGYYSHAGEARAPETGPNALPRMIPSASVIYYGLGLAIVMSVLTIVIVCFADPPNFTREELLTLFRGGVAFGIVVSFVYLSITRWVRSSGALVLESSPGEHSAGLHRHTLPSLPVNEVLGDFEDDWGEEETEPIFSRH